MFSRNGQYIINEFEEDTFDKQLPSESIKIPFKKTRQKVFNRMQQKYELQLLKQQIHQKCKADELAYLDQLQKQKQRFNQMKQEEQKHKKQYLLNFVQKKYQIQQENNFHQKARSKTQNPMRDSIDEIKDQKNRNKIRPNKKLEFSLEPSQQKDIKQVQQNDWIKRVMLGRKKLQQKFGKYYQKEHKKKDSDSESNSSAQ